MCEYLTRAVALVSADASLSLGSGWHVAEPGHSLLMLAAEYVARGRFRLSLRSSRVARRYASGDRSVPQTFMLIACMGC